MLGRPGQLRTGLTERDRRVVVDGLGVHTADHAKIVGRLGDMRDQFADPRAAVAVLRKLEDGGRDRETVLTRRHRGQSLSHPHAVGQFLLVHRLELGFVVEQLKLRREHRTGTGKSPALPWPDDGASRADRLRTATQSRHCRWRRPTPIGRPDAAATSVPNAALPRLSPAACRNMRRFHCWTCLQNSHRMLAPAVACDWVIGCESELGLFFRDRLVQIKQDAGNGRERSQAGLVQGWHRMANRPEQATASAAAASWP